MNDLRTEITQNNLLIYNCKKCNFDTRNKKDFKRHLTTAKHKNHVYLNDFEQDSPQKTQPISCSFCQKEYVSRSGMWYHQKKCKGPPPDPVLIDPSLPTVMPKPEDMMAYVFEIMRDKMPDKPDQSQLVLELLKQNQEFKDLIIEQNKHMMDLAKNAGHNTINNTNTNCNNKFNLNVFLNETCKDAITMDDFINSFEVTREDFLHTGKVGYIEGISKVMANRFRDMDMHTRPLHCTDLKRETIYIKNADKWEKDDADKTHMRKAVRGVARKNKQELWRWYNDNKPEVEQIGTDVCEDYFQYHRSALGGYGKEEDLKFEEKIIRNVLKEVHIDKSVMTVS